MLSLSLYIYYRYKIEGKLESSGSTCFGVQHSSSSPGFVRICGLLRGGHTTSWSQTWCAPSRTCFLFPWVQQPIQQWLAHAAVGAMVHGISNQEGAPVHYLQVCPWSCQGLNGVHEIGWLHDMHSICLCTLKGIISPHFVLWFVQCQSVLTCLLLNSQDIKRSMEDDTLKIPFSAFKFLNLVLSVQGLILGSDLANLRAVKWHWFFLQAIETGNSHAMLRFALSLAGQREKTISLFHKWCHLVSFALWAGLRRWRFSPPADGLPVIRDWLTTWQSMMTGGIDLGREPLSCNVTCLVCIQMPRQQDMFPKVQSVKGKIVFPILTPIKCAAPRWLSGLAASQLPNIGYFFLRLKFHPKCKILTYQKMNLGLIATCSWHLPDRNVRYSGFHGPPSVQCGPCKRVHEGQRHCLRGHGSFRTRHRRWLGANSPIHALFGPIVAFALPRPLDFTYHTYNSLSLMEPNLFVIARQIVFNT